MLDNGKAKARAAVCARSPLLHPIETLEDTALALFRDADAGISNGDFHHFRLISRETDTLPPGSLYLTPFSIRFSSSSLSRSNGIAAERCIPSTFREILASAQQAPGNWLPHCRVEHIGGFLALFDGNALQLRNLENVVDEINEAIHLNADHREEPLLIFR